MLLRTIFFIGCFGFASLSLAQNATLAASIGVMVFPADGQDEREQSIDEAECYNWAVARAGSDPFQLTQQAQQQADAAAQAMRQAEQAGSGSASRSAARGAATGALVGRVFGSSSKDRKRAATAGALIGGAAGRSQRNQAQAQAGAVAAQAERQQAATAQQMDNFKNAFGACLEGKGYISRS